MTDTNPNHDPFVQAFFDNEAEIKVASLIIRKLSEIRAEHESSAVLKSVLLSTIDLQKSMLLKSKTLSRAMVPST
jgi:hypothetical protein